MKGPALCALVLATAVGVSRSAVDESARHRSSSERDFAPGPDNADTGYCTDHSCPGSTIPTSNPSTEAESEDVELDTVSWSFFSIPWPDALISLKDTFVYNVYTKPLEYVYDQATEFAEKVRSVFREEFYGFLDYLWEKGVGTDSKSGKA